MEAFPLDRPSVEALIRTVVDQAPLADSYDHGERHWIRVAWTGRQLLDDGVQADPVVLLLFALFHDSRRINEYEDPQHGKRGGALADELVPGSMVGGEQRDALVTACEVHTDLDSSQHVTIGACLDSDRLNLWRVGKTPDPRFLSTEQARRPERIQWARRIHFELEIDWNDVLDAYGVGSPMTHR